MDPSTITNPGLRCAVLRLHYIIVNASNVIHCDSCGRYLIVHMNTRMPLPQVSKRFPVLMASDVEAWFTHIHASDPDNRLHWCQEHHIPHVNMEGRRMYLAAINPALVHVSISPFGQSGPKAGYAHSEITMMAAGGYAGLTGDEDRAPLRLSLAQA